jgi:hypothetical protein
MNARKPNNFVSPDLMNLQAVIIDHNTTIYIAKGADPVVAKNRYIERNNRKINIQIY